MYNTRGFLYKLQRKYGRFAIQNLMLYIVGAMGAIYVIDMLVPLNLYGMLMFHWGLIVQGEVWRIFTFIFLPPLANPIFIVFALYLYWMIGTGLEAQWGAFRLNAFYFIGMLGTIAGGFITGFATNFYLNLSLFLAFAILYPNFEIRLFFILPVKMKWLALVYLAFLVYDWFTVGFWHFRVAMLISVANVALFFGRDFIGIIKRSYRRAKWRNNQR